MTSPRPAAVVILAAGEGTRMKSATPKVLHPLGGRSLLAHAMRSARAAGAEHLVVVVGHGRDAVADHARQVDPDVIIADQDEVPGTGRAVECGLHALPGDLAGTVLTTMADVPLLRAETLRALTDARAANGVAAVVATATVPDPTGYGRIVRDADGLVCRNVEEKDASAEQRAISEINTGIYAFDAARLRSTLAVVGTDNAPGEKYLSDVLGMLYDAQAGAVGSHPILDPWETEGVNDRVQLARVGAELNRRVVEHWMREGVTVVDPATTWIEDDVVLGPDTVIYPHTQIRGACTIGSRVTLGPDSTLTDTEVRDGATLTRTHASLALVGEGAVVGPFAYLRPGTELGVEGKIGTFVETKNARIGERAKIPHLSYAGDVDVGEGTNIGAGTIVANYDGVAKHHTQVGDHCRTGANNTFVAPVTIGDGASTGGGTVVRRDVPAGALAVSRGSQRNIDGWVARKRAGTSQAEAAAAADPPAVDPPAGEPSAEARPIPTEGPDNAEGEGPS